MCDTVTVFSLFYRRPSACVFYVLFCRRVCVGAVANRQSSFCYTSVVHLRELLTFEVYHYESLVYRFVFFASCVAEVRFSWVLQYFLYVVNLLSTLPPTLFGLSYLMLSYYYIIISARTCICSHTFSYAEWLHNTFHNVWDQELEVFNAYSDIFVCKGHIFSL